MQAGIVARGKINVYMYVTKLALLIIEKRMIDIQI